MMMTKRKMTTMAIEIVMDKSLDLSLCDRSHDDDGDYYYYWAFHWMYLIDCYHWRP